MKKNVLSLYRFQILHVSKMIHRWSHPVLLSFHTAAQLESCSAFNLLHLKLSDCMERSGTFRSEALGEAVFSFWCKKYQRSVLVNAHVSFFENKSQSKSNRAGQKPFTEDFKWRLTGRLASVKPTGCPRVTPKLALRVLTQRRRTHYPANDGITALTHRVATCKWWGRRGGRGGNRLSSEKKRHFPRKSSCQGEGKKVEMDINSQEWKLRWL